VPMVELVRWKASCEFFFNAENMSFYPQWEIELIKMQKCDESLLPISRQLEILLMFANKLGLYEAADFIIEKKTKK